MRAFPPFRRTPYVHGPFRRSRPAQFEARVAPTIVGGVQFHLVCRACLNWTLVPTREAGAEWALRGCPHTPPVPVEPVGGVQDMLAMASPVTPTAGVSVDLRHAAGLE